MTQCKATVPKKFLSLSLSLCFQNYSASPLLWKILASRKMNQTTDIVLDGKGEKELLPAFSNMKLSTKGTQLEHADQTQDEVNPGSKLGDSTIVNKEMKQGNFLLEMQLDPSDVENNVIAFPYEKASNYFPPVPGQSSSVRVLEFSDSLKNQWDMKLSYSHVDRAFVLRSQWQDFVDHHRLDSVDEIYFSIPSRRLHENHYLIEFVRRAEIEGKIPEAETYDYTCEPEVMDLKQGEKNCFLFKLPLTRRDVTSKKLVIPEEEVREHFPGVVIPPETQKLGNMCFTDARNRNWLMELMFCYQRDAYVVTEGWRDFVKEHDLKAADVIKLYKPVEPLDVRHFVVGYVKTDESGTNPT